jgi:hypothetical protein
MMSHRPRSRSNGPRLALLASAAEHERGAVAVHEIAFLVTKATPAPAVSRFVEFVRSAAGAAVIVANGAVPVK